MKKAQKRKGRKKRGTDFDLVPFAEKKLKVPLVPTPFPEDRKERISINSFGIGGANAHVCPS